MYFDLRMQSVTRYIRCQLRLNICNGYSSDIEKTENAFEAGDEDCAADEDSVPDAGKDESEAPEEIENADEDEKEGGEEECGDDDGC
jgi:hypothetical protein